MPEGYYPGALALSLLIPIALCFLMLCAPSGRMKGIAGKAKKM